MTKPNTVTYKWITTVVLIPVIVVVLGLLLQAQNGKIHSVEEDIKTVKTDSMNAISNVAAMSLENRDNIGTITGELKTLRVLLIVSLRAQGVPEAVIEAANNGDSL